MSVPVIVVTDLYQPPEDPGDNFDLVLPFGYDRIDLRAIVLDVSVEKRDSVLEGVPGYPGPREPGVIPVTQLNALFGRAVPYGIAPFARMRSAEDRMRDVPAFQQAGPNLILQTLRDSDEPVEIMSFGSARPIAVALNRDPALFAEKVGRVHLSAGSTSLDYLEWNVYLDPIAVNRLIASDVPLALYPCATEVDCFSYGAHNTLWWMDSLAWIAHLHPALKRYLLYGLGASTRIDFLRALDEDPPGDVADRVYRRRHAVWETAAWLEVSKSAIVHRDGSGYLIVPREEVRTTDAEIRNDLVPCRASGHPSGLYTFELNAGDGRTTVFYRDDPHEYERALQEALPRLYGSFRPPGWQGSLVGALSDGRREPYAGTLGG